MATRLRTSKREVDLKGLCLAWLSPEGRVVIDADDFAPLGAWHEELAACIVRDLLGLPRYRDATDAVRKDGKHYCYEWLEDRGWVRLCAYKSKWVVGERLRSRQRRVIRDWCLENGVEWDSHVEVVF